MLGSTRGLFVNKIFPLERWMTVRHSCSKLFVGGLSPDTNEPVLKEAFGQYGEIIEVKVICNHVTGRSKCYGFVRFTSETACSEALKEMDGQSVDGKRIRVLYAHEGDNGESSA